MDYYNDYHYNHPKTDQPNQYETFEDDKNNVISTGTWILILIMQAVPFVNIIILLVIAFGRFNNNLKNYARAILIMLVIGIFIALLLNGCNY